MDRKWKAGLIGGTIVAIALAGCVEDEASFVMHGNIVGSGSVEMVEIDDGGDDDEDEESSSTIEERASCEIPLEFDEPTVYPRGRINLTELALAGQPLVQGSYAGAQRDQFRFTAVMENRLNDSRTVGAVSGGDGGGFENLELDKNDILIRSARVDFPVAENSHVDLDGNETPFYDDIRHDRLMSMLVQSGGGLAALYVPIVEGSV